MKKPIVNHMTFYPSFREAIDALPTDRERLEAYDMLTDYGIYGEDPAEDISGALRLIFTLAKPNIDNARQKVLNGQKGGRPKKEDKEKTRLKPEDKPVVSSNKDKDKDRDKDIEMDTESLLSLSLKDEDYRAPASADAAGAVLPFTLTDFMECAEEDGLDMTPEEIRKCYQANRRKGFEPPKGKGTFSILATLRGWNKNKAPAPKPKPKPKSKDEQVMEISRAYIPEEELRKYPDKKMQLTGAFCPKSVFIDQGREDLIEHLKEECGVWLFDNPKGTESPIYQNVIARE